MPWCPRRDADGPNAGGRTDCAAGHSRAERITRVQRAAVAYCDGRLGRLCALREEALPAKDTAMARGWVDVETLLWLVVGGFEG